MASTIIHLAIAKELEKKLNIKNKYEYYLGTIAPDLSKQIGRLKQESHFIKNTFNDTPNIEIFKEKYPNFKENDFDLGYFIHIYTDKLWIEDYLQNYTYQNSIKLLDGTILQTTDEEIKELIYSDYTNLNIQLIEEYDIDLSLFYDEFRKPSSNIEEIPLDKLDILINKIGIIIENSKKENTYIFDLFTIKQFIENTTEEIEKELKY